MSRSKIRVQTQTLGDEQLAALARARRKGSTAAYAELVKRHRPELLLRCRLRLGNRADAEDAVQETLMRAYRGLGRFRGDACFRTWLFAIGDNQCHTLAHRRSRHLLTDHLRSLAELHEAARSPCNGPDEEGSIKLVREILAGLPTPARDVLVLRFHSELTLEDIARTLGIGLSACKMRLYRAINEFQDRFAAASAAAL